MTATPQLAARPKEAAGMLGVAARTLEEWRRQGRGPRWIRAGRIVLYPVDGLRAWLDQQQPDSGARP
jgi:predicted site-specific integrase-resolvase